MAHTSPLEQTTAHNSDGWLWPVSDTCTYKYLTESEPDIPDWVIGHVHIGALGWNGFMAFGIVYYLIPVMWRTSLWSKKLANWHFWLGTLGIIFYAVPMYISGFTQGMMWKDFTPEGTLKYGNFLETTLQILPMHAMRAFGGLIYLTGAILMAYNLFKTMAQGTLLANEAAEAAPLAVTEEAEKVLGQNHEPGVE